MITIKDYNEKSFEEVMDQLNQEWDDIHTYDEPWAAVRRYGRFLYCT